MLRRLLVLGAAATAGITNAAVHNITVGASDHRFQPDSVTADIGDTICPSPSLLRRARVANKAVFLSQRSSFTRRITRS